MSEKTTARTKGYYGVADDRGSIRLLWVTVTAGRTSQRWLAERFRTMRAAKERLRKLNCSGRIERCGV